LAICTANIWIILKLLLFMSKYDKKYYLLSIFYIISLVLFYCRKQDVVSKDNFAKANTIKTGLIYPKWLYKNSIIQKNFGPGIINRIFLTSNSLFITSNEAFLTSNSLFITSNKVFLISNSLFITSNGVLLTSNSVFLTINSVLLTSNGALLTSNTILLLMMILV